MTYYTYILKNSLDGIPFYVGKGSNGRVEFQIKSALKGWKSSNNHKSNKIRQIVNQGGEILIEQVFYETEQKAFNNEVRLINEIGTRFDNTGPLLNMTYGGEGNTKLGIEIDQYAINNLDEPLRSFKTIQEASIHIKGNSNLKAGIKQCCLGQRHSVAGYRWAFKNQPIQNTITNKKKLVYQFNNKLELLQIHNNINSIPNVDGSTINCSIKKGVLSYGSFWSYNRNFKPLNPNLIVLNNENIISYHFSLQEVKRLVPFWIHGSRARLPVKKNNYIICTNKWYLEN